MRRWGIYGLFIALNSWHDKLNKLVRCTSTVAATDDDKFDFRYAVAWFERRGQLINYLRPQSLMRLITGPVWENLKREARFMVIINFLGNFESLEAQKLKLMPKLSSGLTGFGQDGGWWCKILSRSFFQRHQPRHCVFTFETCFLVFCYSECWFEAKPKIQMKFHDSQKYFLSHGVNQCLDGHSRSSITRS